MSLRPVDPPEPASPVAPLWDVLVVDDEPVVCEGIRRVLEGEGLRVRLAADADSALALAAGAAGRLVIVDLMLPDRSGVDVVRALHAAWPALPLVMMSGYATGENARQALAAGAAAVLPKPFDATELLELTSRLLGPRPGDAWEEGP